MSAKETILVTSAAGHVGMAVVADLLALGYRVRAFVRADDARAQALKAAGAELYIGDLRDYRDLEQALVGVQRAFYNPPFSSNTVYDSTLFAVAAEQAKLDVVALMGAWNLSPSHPSIHQRGHWIAHHIYRWMPSVDVVHLAPGLFAFPYFLGLPAIAHFGQLMAPFGDGRNAPPSNEDIARVAVEVLDNPGPHVGKSYRPTGPELVSPNDVAEILSRVLDRPVTYKDVPFRSFQKAAIALGYPTEQVAHMRYYAEEVRAGVYARSAPTDHVEKITGRAPEDFESIARRYVANPDLVSPGLRIGSKWSAVAMLFRMMLARPVDLDKWEAERGYPLLQNPTLAHECERWQIASARAEINLLQGPTKERITLAPSSAA
ncbi:MAG: NmrA family NAD(P)-binding protein [Pseudomonadota bacterium]